jgi:lipoate-protein ligase A
MDETNDPRDERNTTASRCRVFPHEDADGPANMARDEAMLDLVIGDPWAAAFRTYGWSEPTLSLGYFQSVSQVEEEPRWRRVPVVRRATGGGAIWHDREVTYALVVPPGHPLTRRSQELYRRVHAAIAGLLVEQGAEPRRRGENVDRRGPERRPFLCFNDHDPEDIVIGRMKVVGSAQRRRSGAVLQHGSVLLARSPFTPELPGAGDLAAVPTGVSFWSERLRHAIPEALGFCSMTEAWPIQVLSRSGALERSVYRNRAWTDRR